ncbi:MAG: hypothetical protein AABZ39_10285 [Spirochaetota bacterium]
MSNDPSNIIVRVIDMMKKHMRIVIIVSVVLLAALVGLSTLVDRTHTHADIEKLPAFWAIFGLVSCLVIIVVSKLLGIIGVSKREDYYDK